jgi:hypothetical protein
MADVELLKLPDDGTDANRVSVAEGTTTKRREPDAEYGPDIAIPDAAKNSFLQAERGLVDHREHTPAHNLVIGKWDMLPGAGACTGADDLVDRIVDAALFPI